MAAAFQVLHEDTCPADEKARILQSFCIGDESLSESSEQIASFLSLCPKFGQLSTSQVLSATESGKVSISSEIGPCWQEEWWSVVEWAAVG